MIYFLHGNNQKELKDFLFDLKKRAPLAEEFDAATAAWEEFSARVKTATFLFSAKKIAARLIALSSFTKSPASFQKSFFEHAEEFSRLPDAIVLFEDSEIKDKHILSALKEHAIIKQFDEKKKAPASTRQGGPARDPLTPFLFGCANAWLRGDRQSALQSAHVFFEHGGSSEQLLFMLAAYAKKTKKPYTLLRTLRDQFIASRLQKADLRARLFTFLSR